VVGGLHDSRILGGMLGLHSNPLKNVWYRISQTVGLSILELGKEVLKGDREVEKGLTPVADEKYAISLCGDARWDKRSSGRNYSSLSGCSVALGCRSQLAWDIEPMSNNCIKCVRKVVLDDDVCARNVTCSAKAMEAVGSERIVNRVCSLGDFFVSEYVGDNDLSIKKVMQHSYADMLRVGKINEWPQYAKKDEKKKGAKKPDNGLLPIAHPEITWLADKSHRIRQVAKKIFGLCVKKKGDYIENNHDAERMKRCLSYAVRQNSNDDSAVLKAAIRQVAEHHFGNHDDCGSWCRVKPLEGDERREADLRYRRKREDKRFYDDVKTIVDEFADGSDDMIHPWSSDIVEGMNKFFTKFLPKDSTYGMSIENKVRIYLAVCIDSIGYVATYERLAQKIGLELGEVHKAMNKLLDARKCYLRKHRKLKKTRAEEEKIL
jgi:hypothetical protein